MLALARSWTRGQPRPEYEGRGKLVRRKKGDVAGAGTPNMMARLPALERITWPWAPARVKRRGGRKEPAPKTKRW
eukprot:scaffold3461_cov116-Isochrysis_galbana.AAC.11